MRMIGLSMFALLAPAAAQTQIPAPPDLRPPLKTGPSCQCLEEATAEPIEMTGIVVDAELTLAPDGLSVNPRQATVFNILPGNAAEQKGRTRIFHHTDPAACGLTFDYGREYKLALRRLENGQFETDACLMPARGHGDTP